MVFNKKKNTEQLSTCICTCVCTLYSSAHVLVPVHCTAQHLYSAAHVPVQCAVKYLYTLQLSTHTCTQYTTAPNKGVSPYRAIVFSTRC